MKGFRKVLREQSELIHREAARLSLALGCTPDRDQFHRIPLGGHFPSPHRVIPQQAQHSTDMRLTLGRKRQSSKPQLHGTRLNLIQRAITPSGKNMVAQPNLVSTSRVGTLRHLLFSIVGHDCTNRETVVRLSLTFDRVPQGLSRAPGCSLGWVFLLGSDPDSSRFCAAYPIEPNLQCVFALFSSCRLLFGRAHG